MSELEAGRELDALIAEEVMGWTWRGIQHHDCSTTPQYHLLAEGEEVSSQPNGEWGYLTDRQDGRIVWSHMPSYSTDIAAAWEVFCKFTSRYIWYDDATDVWHCHFDTRRRIMEDCRHHEISEESAMDAICHAALKAVNGA